MNEEFHYRLIGPPCQFEECRRHATTEVWWENEDGQHRGNILVCRICLRTILETEYRKLKQSIGRR